MKKLLTYIVVAIVLAVVAFFSARYVSTLRNENRRLQNNQTALMNDVRYWRDEADRNYSKAQGITLKVSELEGLRARDAATIRELGVRLHNAQSLVRAAIVVRDTIELTRTDTIMVRDTIYDARYYEDKWTTIVSTPNEAVYSTNVPLTLVTATKQKRYLWGLFWGRVRGIEVVVRSDNPNAIIDSLQYVELQH